LRAEQFSFGITGDIEKVLVESANNKPPACIPSSIAELYGSDINMEELLVQPKTLIVTIVTRSLVQLNILPRFLKAQQTVRSLCAVFKDSPAVGRRMLCEVESLLRI